MGPFTCPACGATGVSVERWGNLRESGPCPACGASNRNRQLAVGATLYATQRLDAPVETLPQLQAQPLRIYNTQCSGSAHTQLKNSTGYVCSGERAAGQALGTFAAGRGRGALAPAPPLRRLPLLQQGTDGSVCDPHPAPGLPLPLLPEYMGPEYESGKVVKRFRHEDLQVLLQLAAQAGRVGGWVGAREASPRCVQGGCKPRRALKCISLACVCVSPVPPAPATQCPPPQHPLCHTHCPPALPPTTHTQATSFPSDSFDLILSTEVFEHIPDPYRAHAELLRVLRPGGAHVFTVPYAPALYEDIVKAHLAPNGSIMFHGAPEYHGDPIRKEGIPVFTIFAQEMTDRLCRLGYLVKVMHLRQPALGILGGNSWVFIAAKPPAAGGASHAQT